MTDTEFLSRMLYEFSAWHEMQGEPFKPRAYELASESVNALGHEVKEAWAKGGIKALKELPGIGESIAEKIDEYFRTGQVKEWETFKRKFPVDIWGLSRIEGLGPKHIKELYDHLKIKKLKDLEKAIAKHQVCELPGFGEKSEMKLSRGFMLMKSESGRQLLGYILPVADRIVAELSKVKGVKRCTYAGSIRRKQETVGDVDLIATTDDPETVMQTFVTLPEVESIHERGKTRSSVRLKIGLDADLRVVPDKVYGATLQYFTGDKRHNILLRERAIRQGYKLSEYGLFKGKKMIVCETEEEIYQKLGLDTPPVEIRVGKDELEAAEKHTLPTLIPYGSVKGDLQTQSDWTDGSSSIADMAASAKKHGLNYIAITDHTKSLAFIGGLDEKELAKQGKEIDALNAKHTASHARLLKGSEVDIRKDGTLDLTDKALAELDFVGIAIHSNFNLTKAAMTARLIKAMSNPNVDCVFHPTGRLIGKRDEYALDLNEVLSAAKKYRVALEIDAYPERSDLRDLYVRLAVDAGVSLMIDTDAHAPEHFAFIPLGEAIARRGWASKRDIVNTKTLKEFKAWLEKKRPRRGWTA